ncbi:MAG: hypothetical protein E6Q91_05190 [Actinobacteria bacterium]|nr:MAG: hypothetical protein E6Q91_05190 [Actinomycetota bacterium]
MDPICSTCGTDFTCFDGVVQPGDAHGWFSCRQRCPVCDGSLRDGSAVMEHPGLGAVIHLRCCPSPEEPEPARFNVFA